MVTSTESFKPPYLSFQTFWNFLGDLSAKPLPPKLDRSIMGSKSGTDQNNIMSALQAFGLIDGEGAIQPGMTHFAKADADQRKEILASLVRTFYSAPLNVSSNNGTPADLDEVFKNDLGQASGDTRRKAISFFLHAAREADLTLSPHFPKTRGGSGGPGAAKKRTPKARRSAQGTADVESSVHQPASGHSNTVALRSGGTVTLSYNVDLFELDDKDETFVLELVKKLRRYNSDGGATHDHTEQGGAS